MDNIYDTHIKQKSNEGHDYQNKIEFVTYWSSGRIGLVGNQEPCCATSLLSRSLSFLGMVSALGGGKEVGLEWEEILNLKMCFIL